MQTQPSIDEPAHTPKTMHHHLVCAESFKVSQTVNESLFCTVTLESALSTAKQKKSEWNETKARTAQHSAAPKQQLSENRKLLQLLIKWGFNFNACIDSNCICIRWKMCLPRCLNIAAMTQYDRNVEQIKSGSKKKQNSFFSLRQIIFSTFENQFWISLS